MASNKVTIEKLFDEDDVAVDKSFFKDAVLRKLHESGKQVLEISPDEAGFAVKVIDSHSASGYNVFKSSAEYKEWLQASLHEPSQNEMQEALSGNGA